MAEESKDTEETLELGMAEDSLVEDTEAIDDVNMGDINSGIAAVDVDPFVPEIPSLFGDGDTIRQITMIIALLVCLVIAVLIFLWANQPELRPLAKMEVEDMIPILDTLEKNDIEYKLKVNVIYVPENQYQDVKLLLLREGVSMNPKDLKKNYLAEDSGFGVSQRLETARLKLEQEKNVAATIEELKNVKRAKVILALPKENVFARKQKAPSATVVLNLRQTHSLEQEEVDAIVDIVASAVRGLNPLKVTVTDQNGRLLNSGSQDILAARAKRELELAKKKEREYLEKIDSILIPILGRDDYIAQVDVMMDFTSVEQTTKRYNPDMPAIRSEMLVENESKGGATSGIPGALTNQPPMESNIPQEAVGENAQNMVPTTNHSEATRNYELDTTISHTKQQIGVVRRVSVSVAINYRLEEQEIEDVGLDEDFGDDTEEAASDEAASEADAAEEEDTETAEEESEEEKIPQYIRVPRTDEELLGYRRLLEGAIGFSQARGDVLEVVNLKFLEEIEIPKIEPMFWEHPMFWRTIKLAAAVIIGIALIFIIIRPLVMRLLKVEEDDLVDDVHELATMEDDLAHDAIGVLDDEDGKYSYSEDGSIDIPDLHKDEDMLQAIRALVLNEPELSIQVVRSWLADD
ncbi:MAG: flagellar M-ring protein FliF [Shewanellaceae bacterium]|nr:flagellar M-ring protein FliF [Shewanellaceae bacterium]